MKIRVSLMAMGIAAALSMKSAPAYAQSSLPPFVTCQDLESKIREINADINRGVSEIELVMLRELVNVLNTQLIDMGCRPCPLPPVIKLSTVDFAE